MCFDQFLKISIGFGVVFLFLMFIFATKDYLILFNTRPLFMLGVDAKIIKLTPEVYRKIAAVKSRKKGASVNDKQKTFDTHAKRNYGKYNVVWE